MPDGFVVPVQGLNAAPVLRGDGAPVEKSAALLSVSVQPLASRRAAVVFVSAGVAVPSKQLAAPNPMRSITPAVGQAPLNAAVPLTSATFPVVALIAIVPVASGGGRLTVPPAPTASCTR